MAQSAASGAAPGILADWYANAHHIPAPPADAPPPPFVPRTRSTYVADGDDVHRFVRRREGEEHLPLTLSVDSARLITQLRSPAPLTRAPVLLNPPEGRAVTSLDTVRKIIRAQGSHARTDPRRKREKPSKNNPFRTPEARDAADDCVRRDTVACLRAQGFEREADRLEKCGTVLGVRSCCDCGHRQAVQTRCDLWQLCPTCNRQRSRRLVAELLRHKELVPKVPGYQWRMLTLTMRITGDPSENVRRMGQSFAKMWRTTLGPKVVQVKGRKITLRPGSAAFRSTEFGGLNGGVHTHVLYYGPFVDHAELKAEWHRQTGDSYITDVRLLRGKNDMSEVAKYTVKLFASTAEKSVAFWQAIRGKQCTQRYGALRGLREAPADEFKIDCELCGSTEYIYTAIAPNDADALRRMLYGRAPPR